VDRGALAAGPGRVAEVAPEPACRPIDLGRLAGVVSDAVDPTVARPLVVDRVLATLPGVADLGPLEVEPDLDLPLWSVLAARTPDWLLPGVGDLEPDGVVGLATAPAFVEALLLGANAQATGELRWRNVPLRPGWSPLRKFWQRAGGELDIAPVRAWPAGAPLADPALSAGPGEEAVVALRTAIFARYPATVVYLYRAAPGFAPPGEGAALVPPDRVDPTFTGTVGPDVTFFGFPVPPAALADHWLVLEEPPAGYRFYATGAVPPPAPGKPDDTSANFAYNRFALPVRVLIGPLL
jgi:hypothetical protein